MRKKLIYLLSLSVTFILLFFLILLNYSYSPFDSSNVKENINLLSSEKYNGRLAGSIENMMVADFIENNTHSLAPNEKLTLKIHSDCIDENEQVIYQDAIKEYYAEKYLANEKELKRNYFVALLLLLAGIFVMSVSIFLNELNIEIWSYVVDIASWVLLWESVDIFLLENRSLVYRRKRYLSYLSMNIEFTK
jgi:formate hydrogenlyase subunit 4